MHHLPSWFSFSKCLTKHVNRIHILHEKALHHLCFIPLLGRTNLAEALRTAQLDASVESELDRLGVSASAWCAVGCVAVVTCLAQAAASHRSSLVKRVVGSNT